MFITLTKILSSKNVFISGTCFVPLASTSHKWHKKPQTCLLKRMF